MKKEVVKLEPIVINEVLPPDNANIVEINNRPVICLYCSHDFMSGFNICKEKDNLKVYIQCPSCNKWNIIRRALLNTKSKEVTETITEEPKTKRMRKDDTLRFEVL